MEVKEHLSSGTAKFSVAQREFVAQFKEVISHSRDDESKECHPSCNLAGEDC
jgi:hypothetical protein